jgi:hypothetical protein
VLLDFRKASRLRNVNGDIWAVGKMQTSEGIGAKYSPMHASHFAAQHELECATARVDRPLRPAGRVDEASATLKVTGGVGLQRPHLKRGATNIPYNITSKP